LKAAAGEVVAAAAVAGVSRLLTVGCTVADSARAASIASGLDQVWATAGVHPHEARHGTTGLEALLDHPSVVAVGECGLDHHYDHSPRAVQADVFRHQIGLANGRDLALVIHTREAWEETFALLDREGTPERTVFHCFTGGVDELHECLARGAYVSFSGIVTFGSAGELRAAALATPPDRLLVETDSPYLAPAPHRGKPNQPAYVTLVGEFLAELRSEPVEQLARTTSANGARLYGLPPPASS
jgi:TatD DNase family protein